MPSPVTRMLRFVLKMVLGLFAALFAVALLFAALIALALSLLTSLITGRKSAPVMMFTRFRQFSQQGMWSGGHPHDNRPGANAGNVVDVEVREIRK